MMNSSTVSPPHFGIPRMLMIRKSMSSSHPLRCLVVVYRLASLAAREVQVGTGRAMLSS